MNEQIKEIIGFGNIEDWFLNQSDELLPQYYPDRGEKSYQQKYKDLKNALLPYHNLVEKGALLKSITDWKEEVLKKINQLKKEITEKCTSESKENLEMLLNIMQQDPAIYLNQHGKGHVEKVIQKVTEIIINFKFDPPTPSETFLLLCAIQIHDIGNVFGRDGHEKSFQNEFMKLAKSIIPDTPTQKLIFKIAQVHSGNINGSKDTISRSKLRFDGMLFDKEIREPVLAALLRFGDELADDNSRSDLLGLELEKIPEECIIYHEYSKALHVVKINNNEYSKTCYLSLEYYIDTNSLLKEYKRDGQSILLIDEIFQRTKKMEQERRYFMRFLSQYISLTEIRVRIEISPDYDLLNSEVFTYTLKEDGYPSNDDILINCPENTAEKIIALLKQKGWRL